MTEQNPPAGIHIRGTNKGEEMVRTHGQEPGRNEHNRHGYRDARDSTGINPEKRRPIDPNSPNMPPA